MAQVYGERWEIVRSLGEGGQAHTFIVQDLAAPAGESAQEFVLKRLKNPNRLGRFEQEVEAVRAIESDRVVPIIDFDVAGDEPYFVSPYKGRSLEEVVHDETLSFDEGLDLFRDVVEATRDAHEVGIVHRDIKPDNVVVDDQSPRRRAYLIDFGICQFDQEGLFTTVVDEAFGARAFAAPELELGAAVEPTGGSDVYSLGKLLYWILTGGRFIAREDLSDDVTARVPEPRGVERSYVKQLLRWTIQTAMEERITSANLLENVELSGQLMRSGVNRVGARDQLCLTCRRGRLKRLGVNDFERVGLSRRGNPEEDLRLLRCDFCGHVQIHYLPGTSAAGLWEV